MHGQNKDISAVAVEDGTTVSVQINKNAVVSTTGLHGIHLVLGHTKDNNSCLYVGGAWSPFTGVHDMPFHPYSC